MIGSAAPLHNTLSDRSLFYCEYQEKNQSQKQWEAEIFVQVRYSLPGYFPKYFRLETDINQNVWWWIEMEGSICESLN